jgi:hypothetical protein
MATEAEDQQLFAAVQQYPAAPGQAIEQLRPLADQGNPIARAILAFALIQQGNAEQGIPYARDAAQEGYGQIAQMYANHLAQMDRPDLRAQAPEFVGWATQAGWPIDAFSLALNSGQRGEPDLVRELLVRSRGPFPLPAATRLEEILSRSEDAGNRISTISEEVVGRREEAVEAIDSEQAAVTSRRENAESAADELGLVLGDVAAHSLAKDYAKGAQRTERQARGYTAASIVLGCLAIAASVTGLLTLKEGSAIDTALARFAFGLPFAIFIPYMNSLASAHRKEAWRLRHVELQIRTANPFLTLLDDDRRKETLAALALRFFPGQEAIGSSEESPSTPLDVIEALRLLLKDQQPKAIATTPMTQPTEPV